jgi:predicted N-acetyltransferase YhbS
VIREARAEDAAAVAALWTEAYVTLGGGGRLEPYVETDFHGTAARGELYVAERGRTIAGVVALLPPGAPGLAVAREEEAELARLAVAATARGEGVGRALAERCTQRARTAGWSAIALWSRPYQGGAHRLYESLGYERAAERDFADETGFGRLVFRLDLRR